MYPGPRSTNIRPLGKIFDALSQPVYLIGQSGRFEYLNAACIEWFDVEPADILGYKPGSSEESTDRLSVLAKAISPPNIVAAGRPLVEPIRPMGNSQEARPAKEVLFLSLAAQDGNCVLAIGDCQSFQDIPPSAIDAIALSKQLAATRQRYPRISHLASLAGTSNRVERLRKQVTLAADSFANVFLSGAPGCGREQIALAIHRQQSVDQVPIVTIDCSLMDAELLEASLSPAIAHLAGQDDRRAALLLRGIDRMPNEAQGPLINCLDEFGARLRCFSLSEKSLEDCISSSSLLTEVAYQLGIFEIQIPSISDRIEDLPVVVQAIIDRRSSHRNPIEGITRPAMDQLSMYPWPGGFDELEMSLRHAINNAHASVIQPQNLPLAIRTFSPEDPSVVDDDRKIDLDRFLFRIECELIDRALRRSDGNRAEAARRLGISRARLLRRIATIAESDEG